MAYISDTCHTHTQTQLVVMTQLHTHNPKRIIRIILVNGKIPSYFRDQHKPFQNDKHFEIQTDYR